MRNLLGLTTLLFANLVFADSYVVEMKSPLNELEINSLKQEKGMKSIQRFTPYSSEYFDRLYSVEFEGKVSDLKKLSSVKLIESDFQADFFEVKANPNSELTTNDLLFPLQWGLQNQNQIISKQTLKGGPKETVGVSGVDIGWKGAIGNIEKNLKKTPVVAVVDMGIDLDHPELKDQILINKAECKANTVDGKTTYTPHNETEKVTLENGNVITVKVDKDKNKYPADCYGYNFAVTDKAYEQFPYDDKNHGTHIAGIIAAKRNNENGVSGVSDKIKILPIKVTGRVDETSDRNRLLMKAPSKRIANGILYAVRRGVDVINLSLGWPKSMDTVFMRKVIEEAISKNIVVVAAAGNNNTNANIYPCSYENVICVGSVDADGSISAFSNYGGEVDILAPGDQILSTIPTSFIPLKMNIQGYDILSGTSQAAPYVSAAAALIKGVNPKASVQEVMRRLYDSAQKKKDEFKSMHGILNLKNAFKIKSAPSIKPVFKLNSEITFDPRNGDFNLYLPVRNYGTTAKNVKIEVFFKDRSIKLKGYSLTIPEMINYNQLKTNRIIEETKTGKKLPDMSILKFSGRVFNKYSDNLSRYKVVITTTNEEGKVTSKKGYEHEVTVSKKFFTPSKNDSKAFKFVFKNPNKKVPVGLWDKKEKKLSDNLRTVENLLIKEEMPSYYVKFQPKAKKDEVLEADKDGIRLFFFEFENNEYKERENEFFISRAVKLLSVTKSDYNYDGIADYLIKTVVKPADAQGYILYSYRTNAMEPLVGLYSDIRYYPELVNVTPETVRLMKTELPNGLNLATPYFVSQGELADADQVKDPWAKKDRSVMRRIYKLSVVENDFIEFKARTDMNRTFIKSVKNKLKDSVTQTIALNDTTFEIIQLLNQDSESFYAGEVKAIASFGLGYYRENIEVVFTASGFEISVLDKVQERIEANTHHALYELNNDAKGMGNTFVGFLTDDLVTVNSVKGNSELAFTYRMRDLNDRLLSFLALFENDKNQTAIFETVDYILLVDVVGTKQNTLKRKTKKFSFLPGSRMSELYIPMKIKSLSKGLVPAVYVDATSIVGNNIYVMTQIGEKFTTPIDMSFDIPKNCVAKEPVSGLDGASKASILCLTNDGFKIKYIDFVAP
jgi:hypothetical protein